MSDDLHCSMGAGRSFVDPVTNWALISGVDLNRDLGGMLQAGQYPQEYFGDFVHELTHHWCFHSPVGLALALLQIRARRRAFLILDGQPERNTDAYSVADDLVRYESAIGVMRPLAEGLALFAEYDALPADSPIMSTPMVMSAITFGTPDPKAPPSGQDAWNSLVGAMLLRHRLSPRFVERKAALLKQPLTGAAGGYLAGYLTVKNMWTYLRRRSAKLWDSDLFLAYVKTCFYDDYAFVATLLDPDTEIMSTGAGKRDCVERIVLSFQERLAELLRVTSDQTVGEFEQWTLARQPWQTGELWLAGSDPARAALGRQRLDDWLADLDATDDVGALDQQMRTQAQWTIAQRDLFCIGSFKAPVRVNEHGRVFVGVYEGSTADYQFPVYNLKGLDGITEGADVGSLEYFISPGFRYSVIAVTRGGKLVAVTTMGSKVSPELEEQIKRYRTSLEEGLSERQMLSSLIEEVLEESSASVYREHYKTNVSAVHAQFFVDKALAHTPEADVPAVSELLRNRGFLDVLGGDNSQLKALARLSLVSGMSPDREFIAEEMADDKYDLDATLAIVRSCEERNPIKLIATAGRPGGRSFVQSLV